MYFLYLIEQHSKLFTYLIGALYVHSLWYVQIRTAIETITVDVIQTIWNELDYRVDVCRITKGAHIEHL